MPESKFLGQVTFRGTLCEVELTAYQDSRPALLLHDFKDKQLHTIASVNLEDNLRPGHVFIKDYSENAGIAKVLEDAGIISPPVELHYSGFVVIPECKILKQEEQEQLDIRPLI